jgi:glycosyltransferase involved in cell wall biosynthesis
MIGPLISCLMVTRGALYPAHCAIDGFLAQTFSPRELVILSDTPSPELTEYVLTLADPRIHLVRTGTALLGALRNETIAAAKGPLVAQWDDDDLHAPDRLAVQYAALRQSGGAAILLQRWTMWWPNRYRLALSGSRGWEGTIVGWKQRLSPYPPLASGEDSAMIAAMIDRGEAIGMIDRPDLYCYVVHGRNTFGPSHFNGLFAAASERFEFADYDRAIAARSQFPFAAYAAGLAARTE